MKRCPRCKVVDFGEPGEHDVAICTMRVRAQLDKALHRYQRLQDRYSALVESDAVAAIGGHGPSVMTKQEMREALHKLNPYAGYLRSKLTAAQLRATLDRYAALERHDYAALPKRNAT